MQIILPLAVFIKTMKRFLPPNTFTPLNMTAIAKTFKEYKINKLELLVVHTAIPLEVCLCIRF